MNRWCLFTPAYILSEELREEMKSVQYSQYNIPAQTASREEDMNFVHHRKIYGKKICNVVQRDDEK